MTDTPTTDAPTPPATPEPDQLAFDEPSAPGAGRAVDVVPEQDPAEDIADDIDDEPAPAEPTPPEPESVWPYASP